MGSKMGNARKLLTQTVQRKINLFCLNKSKDLLADICSRWFSGALQKYLHNKVVLLSNDVVKAVKEKFVECIRFFGMEILFIELYIAILMG